MANYDVNILIKNIKKLMENNSLTQEQLAEKLNMSQPNISKALNSKNKKNFTLDQLIGIAKYFNVSVDTLLGSSNSPSSKLSPRSIAMFFSKLISSHQADVEFIEKEEHIYKINYYDGENSDCSEDDVSINYPAIYLPSYWQIDETKDTKTQEDQEEKAMNYGNETEMLGVNNFIKHFKEIFDQYDKGTLTEETYKIVVDDMLSRLKD